MSLHRRKKTDLASKTEVIWQINGPHRQPRRSPTNTVGTAPMFLHSEYTRRLLTANQDLLVADENWRNERWTCTGYRLCRSNVHMSRYIYIYMYVYICLYAERDSKSLTVCQAVTLGLRHKKWTGNLSCGISGALVLIGHGKSLWQYSVLQ